MVPESRTMRVFLARKHYHIVKKVAPKEHVKIVKRIQRITHDGF